MVPPCERFDADDAARREVDLWLVVHTELAVDDRPLELAEKRQATVVPRSRRAVPAHRMVGHLGVVHGLVGVLQEQLDVRPVIRIHRDADAPVDLDRKVADHTRRREHIVHALRRGERALDTIDVDQQDRELVATEASGDVGAPARDAQPERDLLQHEVADLVPETVVDLFEPVEVEHRDGERVTRPNRVHVRKAGVLEELAAVGKVGERVVRRLVLTAQGETGRSVHVPHCDDEQGHEERAADRGDREHRSEREQHAVGRQVRRDALADHRERTDALVQREHHARQRDVGDEREARPR